MFRFDHIALAVSDLARSAAFYEALGAQRVSRPSPHFVELMLGELRMHLTRAPHPTSESGSQRGNCVEHFCIAVSTLDELTMLRDLINQHPLTAPRGPFAIQESPPLDAARTGHVEQHVPRHTLYFQDPDGIHLEARLY